MRAACAFWRMRSSGEAKRLREYEAAAEEKRRQVVAARQDTASLEKLKDKKWEDYQKQVQKGEELLIEELVTAARARTGGLTARSHTLKGGENHEYNCYCFR